MTEQKLAEIAPNALEAIAHNLCSLHGFEVGFVMQQERFAKAVITEYLRTAPPAPSGWRSMERYPGTPERDLMVLVAEQDGSVYEARITEDGWYARNNDSTDHWGGEIYPVAWMPKPEYTGSAAPSPDMEFAPVKVTIYCPECALPHIDDGEWAERPHKTHQCQGCGHEWRPFPFATVGIPHPVLGSDDVRKAAARLNALANIIERPPLDDVHLEQKVALDAVNDIRTVIDALSAPVSGGEE